MNDNITKAIAAMKSQRLSLREAAKRYGIPKSTLSDRCRGKGGLSKKCGRRPVFTVSEESIILRWIEKMVKRHLPITKATVLRMAQKMLKDEKEKGIVRETLRDGKVVTERWWECFRKRNPSVTHRVPEAISSARGSVTEGYIRQWFSSAEDPFLPSLKAVLLPHRC